jgi:carbamoylphosphate synthase large subunit
MIVGIHQPNFFPWLGYFDKLNKSDVFILLDDIQFPKTGAGTMSNRVKILTNGKPQWITASIIREAMGKKAINEVEFRNDLPWRDKIIGKLKSDYRSSAFFLEVFDFLSPLIQNKEVCIAQYNYTAICSICEKIGLDSSKISWASNISHQGTSNHLLASLTKRVGGGVYLTGEGGAIEYLQKDVFETQGLRVDYQHFEHPKYTQENSDKFIAGLSIIDALMSVGFDGVAKMLSQEKVDADITRLDFDPKWIRKRSTRLGVGRSGNRKSNQPLKLMITAAGAPQSPTLIRFLKENGERDVELIGVDMDAEASGRFLADKFHHIPRAGAFGYRKAILEVIREHKPDCLINVSHADVPFIAQIAPEIEAQGTAICGSDIRLVNIANNKLHLYELCRRLSPDLVPRFASPRTYEEFVETAREMGYPDLEVCFKPHEGKGSRGFRILSEKFDRRDQLLNQKPVSRYMTLDEFSNIFRESRNFPKLLLMEVVSGEECDVMTIGYEGEALLTTIKSRESHRWGVISRGAFIERPELVDRTKEIIRAIPLSYNLSLQFMGGKLIEINPRTSTFIYGEGFSEPWLAVKLALGLIDPDTVASYQSRIPIGRRMARYMDQVFY